MTGSITIYTPCNLKKLLKKHLLSHIITLYSFINIFDGESIVQLKEENETLKEEIKELKDFKKQIEELLSLHKE